MVADFSEHFWGEKNNGFDVLYHNMKHGLVASRELHEFLREKTSIEEHNMKMLAKLAHKSGSGMQNSSFSPLWTLLRGSAEKLSTLHQSMVKKLMELVKDVSKYVDELSRKHKTVKEEESHTLECVQSLQASSAAVHKLRDLYASKVLELERLRKENASQKDVDKHETKLKKIQDEYRLLVEKYTLIKTEFEERMTRSCKRFQDVEEAHLHHMRQFLSTYLELVQSNNNMVGQMHSEFKRQFVELSIENLLDSFVRHKGTGIERPAVPELDFMPLSTQSSSACRLNQQQLVAGSNSNSAISMDQRNVDIACVGASGGSLLSGESFAVGGATSGSVDETHNELFGISPPVSESLAPTNTAVTSLKSNIRSWFLSGGSASKQSVTAPASPGSSSANNMGGGSALGNIETEKIPPTTNDSVPKPSTLLTQPIEPFHFNKTNTHDALTSRHNNHATNCLPLPSFSDYEPDDQNVDQATEQQTEMDPNNAYNGVGSKANNGAEHYNCEETLTPSDKPLTPATTGSNSAAPPPSNTRRTTSLLNIFSSNSQVTGILRSRREKAKSKKSKRRKDGGEAGELGQEESQQQKPTGGERAISALLDFEDRGKMKTQSSSGSSAAGVGLALSTASAPGSVDSGGAGSVGIAGSGTQHGGNAAVTTAVTTNTTTSSTAAVTAASGYGAIEIDEDGFSIQPAKESAWEENTDKARGFYSESDTDSDNDKPEPRIHVTIKPLGSGQAPMSASVDELRATVENMSLSPTGILAQHNQHTQPVRAPSRQQSPEISNASTPTTSVHPYAPLQSPTLSMSNTNNRYADLGDIFSELSDANFTAPTSAATLSKLNSRQIPTPTSVTGSIAIPRPPSRRSEMITPSSSSMSAKLASRLSPLPIAHAESISSLEFRAAAGNIGSMGNIGVSRGPSPLTSGPVDTVSIAVAFHEIVHTVFRGNAENLCRVKIYGDMTISFPSGIAGALVNSSSPAKLAFRVKNVQNLEKVVTNDDLVEIDRSQSSNYSTLLVFNMNALTVLLRRLADKNPKAPHFNVDILKYVVRAKPGTKSCPLHLVGYWKFEPKRTSLKIDYTYNKNAVTSTSPLLNITLSATIDGGVKNVQSHPHSAWLAESNRIVWNFTEISPSADDNGVGSLRARFGVSEGPSTPSVITAQFNCEGMTLSGLEFELHGSGYRVSLVKRRFVSGKYLCEGVSIQPGAAASVGSSSPYSARSN